METIKERLLNDKNIFLSIYLVESYIQNKELLSYADRKLLAELRDIFNIEKVENVIDEVKIRLEKLLDDERDFFEVTVFFKPKKYDKGKVVFRPLHTAKLIDQIAMIAMLQILVYDIGEKGRLIPSELSRLIPSNFYGNRISFDAQNLFKLWQDQYKEYTGTANNMLYNYCATLEYKYEVSLDLENFFPSINPQVVYNFISEQIPLKFNAEDKMIIETIIRKLLLFKLCKLTEEEKRWYLPEEPSDDGHIENKCIYAKGIPQGLPHTYFIANLFMLLIKNKYEEIFPGEMLFYVDDSVIFTNGKDGYIDNSLFEKQIAELNNKIREEEKKFLKTKTQIFPEDYDYNENSFGVCVHDANTKSVFASISDAMNHSGEMYLKWLGRETSNLSFDIFTAFSDEEVDMIFNRTKAILQAIKKEICKVNNDENKKVYKDKLLRYKKFFSYRKTILEYKKTGNIDQLKNEVIKYISLRGQDEKLEEFFDRYNDDILSVAILFVFKRCNYESVDVTDLITAVNRLNEVLYNQSCHHSYLLKSYEPYFKNQAEYNNQDVYETLCKIISRKYCTVRTQSYKRKYKKFDEDIINRCKNDYEPLYDFFGLSKLFKYSEHIRNNSNNVERMILNAVFSYLFEYEIDDKFTFAKRSRFLIQYSEVRILSLLRNMDFAPDRFTTKYIECTRDEDCNAIDYSLLQVLELFKTFVVRSERIDNLILIHKYCCDTWKNGSKYLHFYTLHNQEHAVSLIRSSIQLLHSISYFKLKQIDYYILFASCYLHDISMVTLPNVNEFYTGHDETSDFIYTDFINKINKNSSLETKKALCDAYKQIDGFFEMDIRKNHANNSAIEIRKFKELDFIEPVVRELIADVCCAHGYDVADIYYVKSNGSASLVNEKFIKILLRLSDLLDMSRYRISQIILNHNLENLNIISRFHWISHLITNGYNLNTEYKLSDQANDINHETFLKKGSITEKLVLTVDVLMSQTTKVPNGDRCHNIHNSDISIGDDGQTTIKLSCDRDSCCNSSQCNFLCKWFVIKNDYLFKEFGELKRYLNSIQDNFFSSEIEIDVRVVDNQNIPNDVFDYLREYIMNN